MTTEPTTGPVVRIRCLSRMLPGYRAGRRAILDDLRFLIETAPTQEAADVLTATVDWLQQAGAR